MDYYAIEYDISNHKEGGIVSFLACLPNTDVVKKYLKFSLKKEGIKGYRFGIKQ